ncbi:MAG: gluconate 2-dehydrogenase subunit 3 family protein [SAR202 cluster bacterium]|jgi:hypothetical protein|nr:gluconate 2-dehydrogenase subunit 3 family protein [SAR202 cluster bacterium]|tara:strand:- start:4032 stop:4493 length:462 start_codon:yes stop_codon:yes gene_type:complete
MTNNSIFDQERLEILNAILGVLIPSNETMPSASELNIEPLINDLTNRTNETKKLILDGLQQINIYAVQQYGMPFTQLPKTGKTEALSEAESTNNAFFSTLLRFAYDGYYSHPDVFESLGYTIPNPLDYKLDEPNKDLLEPQRQRKPFWTNPDS